LFGGLYFSLVKIYLLSVVGFERFYLFFFLLVVFLLEEGLVLADTGSATVSTSLGLSIHSWHMKVSYASCDVKKAHTTLLQAVQALGINSTPKTF
jgi:hypothetical protein